MYVQCLEEAKAANKEGGGGHQAIRGDDDDEGAETAPESESEIPFECPARHRLWETRYVCMCVCMYV